MIWYAFLHILDLNGILPPKGPLRAPKGPLRAPEGPLRAPWGSLRAPESSETCLPYSPLKVDMIWYAFLHTLDLNEIFTPWGPPEDLLMGPWGSLRAPEASKTCLPYSPLNVDMIWYAFLHTWDLNGIFTPWGPPEGPLRAPWGLLKPRKHVYRTPHWM